MYSIKELAEKTNSQPKELAKWLGLDNWEHATKVSTLDAIEWLLQADIGIAISARDYRTAWLLTEICNETFAPKVDTDKKA